MLTRARDHSLRSRLLGFAHGLMCPIWEFSGMPLSDHSPSGPLSSCPEQREPEAVMALFGRGDHDGKALRLGHALNSWSTISRSSVSPKSALNESRGCIWLRCAPAHYRVRDRLPFRRSTQDRKSVV